MLLGEAGYTTQAVGKWHLGENVESQPQHVGYDDFYGFLSVSDMYTEWRDPHFFPEIVYSEARTEWVKNMPFNRCFVHAKKGAELSNVEEVTIPCCRSSTTNGAGTRSSSSRSRPTADSRGCSTTARAGAHFDNYPHEKFLGKSPARHPYKDTLIELDDIMGRLVEALRRTGQLEDTLIFVSSDNGPHMETWPDAAFTPFRCAKGSTWEGGVRVPGLMSWPGTIEAGSRATGCSTSTTSCRPRSASPGASELLPSDRYIDGVDQSSFLLAPDGLSNRKYHYYWLSQTFSGLRCGEYKMAAVGDQRRRRPDACGPGGFTGVLERFAYPRLYNLYLDPKEQHNYLTRKLAYVEAFQLGLRNHLGTFRHVPPKKVMGVKVADNARDRRCRK
jgi:arylsulfatase